MQRILLLTAVSVIIFEGHAAAAVPIAIAVVLAAAVTGPWTGRTVRVHPLRLLRFLPYFLVASARGGIDVVARALRGSGALRPGFVEYRTGLQGELRVFFANIVSLLPGTLTARFSEDVLIVHVLDTRSSVTERLQALELQVARAFGAAP
jgi:multicomponent Na+:H+ antiporter subunit E